jgi:lipopolysaccharide export system protein LptA
MFINIICFITAAMFAVQASAAVDVGINHDSSKPVEITADSLEVLQGENKAIFTGEVQAKQGDLDIRSEKMTVYYKKGDKKQKGDASKISRVEIDRNVFISTKKETAKGDKGIYDVDTAIITLEGNVTLTSLKNIVKGQKLVYNIKTGQSKIISGSGNSNNNGGKKERVRGVFVPGGK